MSRASRDIVKLGGANGTFQNIASSLYVTGIEKLKPETKRKQTGGNEVNKIRLLAAVAGTVAVLGLAAACSNGEAATTGDTPPAPPAGAAIAPAGPAVAPEVPAAAGAPAVGAPSGVAIAPVPAIAPPAQTSGFGAPVSAPRSVSAQASGTSQAGIWVSGQGTFTLEPDLALLNIGVESMKATVAQARDEAATAMDAILSALSARGIEGTDVQTRFFNISPRYEWREVFDEGFRTNKQVLIGYQVNNSASVKIRDLDVAGDIVDEVVTAGGDVVRINGISFTVEDPKPFMGKLREAAVRDALTKAQQFADLTSVSLGRLVFIGESTGSTPVIMDFQERAFAQAAAAPAPSTAISGGELELRMTVQAVFDIL